MANVLSDQFAYVLADITGMMLEARMAGLRGKGKVSVTIGGMPVEFKPEVVSSHCARTCTMLIVRMSGNLAMLASATDSPGQTKIEARVSLLNVAKMERTADLLELHKPRDHSVALKLLGNAVVATYAKTGTNEWTDIAA